MALITNALTLLGVDVYWQTFVIGGTLLTAVLIDRLGKLRTDRPPAMAGRSAERGTGKPGST
jgi:ribose/xylose/arabinose/galactoside ABC-type transport system permease subunit